MSCYAAKKISMKKKQKNKWNLEKALKKTGKKEIFAFFPFILFASYCWLLFLLHFTLIVTLISPYTLFRLYNNLKEFIPIYAIHTMLFIFIFILCCFVAAAADSSFSFISLNFYPLFAILCVCVCIKIENINRIPFFSPLFRFRFFFFFVSLESIRMSWCVCASAYFKNNPKMKMNGKL